MTHRLLVNPGTPQSWEIQLKAGANRIGRREENDHQIDHGSVSGTHCEIVVNDGSVHLKDLGSTNGTFVNRAPVQEISLQSGQHVQLGNVDMIFETTGATDAVTAGPTPPLPPSLRLNLSRPQPPAQSAPPIQEIQEEPPIAPPLSPPVQTIGAAFCKIHPKTPARFHCQKCRKYFCDLCVMTRPAGGSPGKFCRACGSAVVPVQVQITHAAEKGFFARLPGAVIYPFRGSGLLVLIAATLVFTALQFISGGLLGIFVQIIALGYLFSFMQNIIFATAAEEKEMPELPGMDDLFSSCFRLLGTITLSFGLAIGLAVAKFFFDVDIPVAALIATVIFGCLYFPMAFLAVAMKDTVVAANPLVVVPAILKMPLEYLVTTILLISVFGIRALGDVMSGVAGGVSYSTKSMSVLFLAFALKAVWSFVNVYLLTVNMRILGILYVTKKHKLGWFRH